MSGTESSDPGCAGGPGICQLVAGAPYSGDERLSLFGRFVGDWEILEDRFFHDDGSTEVHRGELHWGWILDGRATQDVWMWFDEEEGRMRPVGTTIRMPVEHSDRWLSIWMVPERSQVQTFIARKEGTEIVLEGTSADGKQVRWIFFNITDDAFGWKEIASDDGWKSWKLTEEMKIKRIAMSF